jgi:hypothetical protein
MKKSKYFIATQYGAINGMIKDNVNIGVDEFGLSYNFVEMYKQKKVLQNFKKQFPEKSIRKDFFKQDN